MNRKIDFIINMPPELGAYVVCKYNEKTNSWQIVAGYSNHYFTVELPFAVGVASSIMKQWPDIDRLSIFCLWKGGESAFCGAIERRKEPWVHHDMAPLDRQDLPDNLAIAVFKDNYRQFDAGKIKLEVEILA